MKKAILTVSFYIVTVYFLSLFLKEAYIHVLIGLIAAHLMFSLVSTFEKEDEPETIKPQWKTPTALTIMLIGLIALNYYLPVLEVLGAL